VAVTVSRSVAPAAVGRTVAVTVSRNVATAVSTIGYVNCCVLITAVAVGWSITSVVDRFDPNLAIESVARASASHALHRQISQAFVQFISSWAFGTVASAALPW
jgi:hypothetical protein